MRELIMTIFMFTVFILSSMALVYLMKFGFSNKTSNTNTNKLEAKNKKSLKGQIAIVTGSSDGIGVATAEELLKSGATVIYACRNQEKTLKVISKLPSQLQDNAIFMKLKLDSFSSIKEFCTEFKSKFQHLNILINNAAIINNEKILTEDGIEASMQVNTYSPMILTQELIPLLNKAGGRVINVSSRSHALCKVNSNDIKNTWSMQSEEFYLEDKLLYPQYGATKLGNILFTHYLSEYFKNNNLNIKAVSLHPGAIKTSLMRSHNFIHFITYYLYLNRLGMNNLTLLEGAQTTLHCCYEDTEKLSCGGYYVNCSESSPAPHASKAEVDTRNEFVEFARKIINKAGRKHEINFNILLKQEV